jgi:hypothetical protein
MRQIITGAQAGLREFFSNEAALPGEVTLSLWDFDNPGNIRCLHSFARPAEAASYIIEPRGMTALYDAIAEVVAAEGAKLAALSEDERPEDVTVIIASDGEENQSAKYPKPHGGPLVKAMLDHQQEVYGWRVLYLGTNQDALAESAAIGVAGGSTLSYVNTSTSTQNSWGATNDLLTRAPVAAAVPGGQGFVYSRMERQKGESAVRCTADAQPADDDAHPADDDVADSQA